MADVHAEDTKPSVDVKLNDEREVHPESDETLMLD